MKTYDEFIKEGFLDGGFGKRKKAGYDKVLKTIKSVNNVSQLDVAEKMFKNFNNKYGEESLFLKDKDIDKLRGYIALKREKYGKSVSIPKSKKEKPAKDYVERKKILAFKKSLIKFVNKRIE